MWDYHVAIHMLFFNLIIMFKVSRCLFHSSFRLFKYIYHYFNCMNVIFTKHHERKYYYIFFRELEVK
ncbi:unnamed protein product, partial [Vitis vinifera]|uniref:Uncharacterized protein n=1 Tax=Vitis vinifera TaxID=29760 RepID=D7TAR0_VITVI